MQRLFIILSVLLLSACSVSSDSSEVADEAALPVAPQATVNPSAAPLIAYQSASPSLVPPTFAPGLAATSVPLTSPGQTARASADPNFTFTPVTTSTPAPRTSAPATSAPVASSAPAGPPLDAQALASRPLTLTDLPAGYRQLTDSERTLSDILSAYTDPEPERKRLEQVGFVAAWRRTFENPQPGGSANIQISAIVTSYQTSAGALRSLSDSLDRMLQVASTATAEQIQLPATYGDRSYGVIVRGGDANTTFVFLYALWADGNTRGSVQIAGLGVDVPRQLLFDLARTQAERLHANR